MNNLYEATNLLSITIGKNLSDEKFLTPISEAITRTRDDIFSEYGVRLPPVRIHDGSINPFEYSIDVNDIPLGNFTLEDDSVLILDTGNVTKRMRGKSTKEPSFKMDAQWVPSSKKDLAVKNGYVVATYKSIVSVHLTEIAKKNLPSVITTQYVSDLLDEIDDDNRALTRNLSFKFDGDQFPFCMGPKSTGTVKKILRSLLEENVSIKNIIPILEAICDGEGDENPNQILERVRKSIALNIIMPYIENNAVHVFEFSDPLQQHLIKTVGTNMNIEFANRVTDFMADSEMGGDPCIVWPPFFRQALHIHADRKRLDIPFISGDEWLAVTKALPSLKISVTKIDFEIPKEPSLDAVKEMAEKIEKHYSQPMGKI